MFHYYFFCSRRGAASQAQSCSQASPHHEGIQRLRPPTECTDCSAFKDDKKPLFLIGINSMRCDAVCSSVNFVCFHRNSQSFLKMSGLYSFLPASEGNGSPERSRLLRLARRRQSIVTFISLWRGSSHVLMVLSYDPDATFVPSGENDTLFTIEECPSSVCRHSSFFTRIDRSILQLLSLGYDVNAASVALLLLSVPVQRLLFLFQERSCSHKLRIVCKLRHEGYSD